MNLVFFCSASLCVDLTFGPLNEVVLPLPLAPPDVARPPVLAEAAAATAAARLVLAADATEVEEVEADWTAEVDNPRERDPFFPLRWGC